MHDVSFLGCRVDPATEPVPPAFVTCAVETVRLTQRWLDAQDDEHTVLAALRGCTVEHDGHVWAYGTTSGRWFVRNADGSWEPSHPTLMAVG